VLCKIPFNMEGKKMLTKEQLLEALRLLGDKLASEGKEGELLLTGGAAMALVHDARDMTKDIDALYAPKSDINRISKSVADEMDLPDDWLNDSVKGFLSDSSESHEFISFPGLRINSVTPEYLLAMKLLSARLGETDIGDIKFLFNMLEIEHADQAYKILERFYPEKRVLPKTMYLIEEMLQG